MHASETDAVKLCIRLCGSGIFWRKDSHRWSGRRPAVCIVRTDLFCTGRCQEYIWHRLFPADEHRGRAGIFGKWAGYYDRVGHRRKSVLCAGGINLRGRSGDSVAAWWTAGDWFRGRFGIYGKESKRYPRLLCSAGVYRTGSTVLGSVRQRNDRGTDTWCK